MLLFEIPGAPVPWQASRLSKGRFFDPKYEEKQDAILQIKSQYIGEPISGPVRVDLEFHMPIPASVSKKKRVAMEKGEIPHTSKPDRINMAKLYEDVLERAGVLSNDSIIISGDVQKHYSVTPKTVISITVSY